MTILGVIGTVLLTLLKVILILLLVLLVLLLLILCIPVGYEATGKADGSQGLSGVEIHARLWAFLGLVRFFGQFCGGEIRYALKLAGFTLKKGGRKPERREDPEKELPEEKERPPEEEEPEISPAEKPPETNVSPGQTEEAGPPEEPARPEKEQSETQEETVLEEESSRGPGERLSDILERVSEGVSRIPDAIDSAADAAASAADKAGETQDKLTAAWDKALEVWDMLQKPENVRTMQRVKKAVLRILKHVLPEVFRLKGVFGTGDPAQTGQILGLFYMLYPAYADRWDLELSGDFLEKRIQGKFYLKGRVFLIAIVGNVLGLLRDRNIRRWIFKIIRKKKK